MAAHSYRKKSDLPERLPVFPLPGAILFPNWTLPLNIFEPRYLNMIDDAMSSHRIIGMVQSLGGDATRPKLASVGCAGRITSYSETEDGRYLITLSGVCRFDASQELEVQTPYRQVTPDWDQFLHDLRLVSKEDLPSRDTLVSSLRRYSETNTMDVDWDAVEHADMETLVSALCAGCPFGVMEKQALLEAPTVAARAAALATLLDMDVSGDDTTTLQ